MSSLEARDLRVGYGGPDIVSGLDLRIEPLDRGTLGRRIRHREGFYPISGLRA